MSFPFLFKIWNIPTNRKKFNYHSKDQSSYLFNSTTILLLLYPPSVLLFIILMILYLSIPLYNITSTTSELLNSSSLSNGWLQFLFLRWHLRTFSRYPFSNLNAYFLLYFPNSLNQLKSCLRLLILSCVFQR